MNFILEFKRKIVWFIRKILISIFFNITGLALLPKNLLKNNSHLQ
jgi:hypothetical protein